MAALLLILTSCKEEEGGLKLFPQELLLEGERYEIERAYLIDFFTLGPEINGLQLHLYTEGLNVVEDSLGRPVSVTGSGFRVIYDPISRNFGELSAGTYTIDTTGGFRPNTFRLPFISFFSNGTELSNRRIESGEMEVIRQGDLYTITGFGRDEDRREFSFSYQGVIPVL